MKYLKLIILSIILISFVGCKIFEKTIIIPKTTIQGVLDSKFPIKKNMVLMKHTLSDPKVYFNGKNIGIKVNYKGMYLEKEIDADVDVAGKIFYNQKKGAFYLQNFDIVSFDVNDMNFTPSDKLKNGLINVLNNYIAKYPVYKLKQGDVKQSLAKLLLKDVSVQGNNLVILLSL